MDWPRRRAYVEVAETRGAARWMSVAQPQSFALVQAERRILLGELPVGVALSERAQRRLPRVREERADHVDRSCTLVVTEGRRTRWWTWAGARANAVLVTALEAVDPTLVDGDYVYDNQHLGLRSSVTAAEVRHAIHGAQRRLGGELGGVTPFVTERTLQQLKFADLLPPVLARQTLEARLADPAGAAAVLQQPVATHA